MSRRVGFTLIELLVVVTIIVILAGLILVGANLLREQARDQQSEAICQLVHQAVLTGAAAGRGRASPAEHPLAGSAAPRHAFVRAGGGAVSASGTALKGIPLSAVASGQDRVLLGDDRYADPDVPLLYGLRRDEIGIIGPSYAAVTAYRQLPHQPGPITNPDTAGRALTPNDGPEVARRLFDHYLGQGPALTELAKLEALDTPDDDTALLDGGRVWDAAPRRLDRATQARLDGSWRHYRLRGLAIYDSHQNEILYRVTEAGDNVVVMSAGRDGHFVFDPLADGFQTDPWADSPATGDADAREDNVVVGGVE